MARAVRQLLGTLALCFAQSASIAAPAEPLAVAEGAQPAISSSPNPGAGTGSGIEQGTIPTAPSPPSDGFFDGLPMAKQFEAQLRRAADLHGVDFYLLQALIATESGFNVRALSHSGAVGLMQIMPKTAARLGLSGDKKNPIRKQLQDPQTNIHYGAKYLALIQNLFAGRLDLALAAYNAGEYAVQRAGNQVPNIPETQKFVSKVTGIYTDLKARALAQILPAGLALEPLSGVPGSEPALINSEAANPPFGPAPPIH